MGRQHVEEIRGKGPCAIASVVFAEFVVGQGDAILEKVLGEDAAGRVSPLEEST